MKRREFITLLGGAAAWPLAAQAQQRRLPRLCFLTFDPGTLRTRSPRFDGFFQGLQDLGYVNARNIEISYLSADNNGDRFPTLIDECLSLRPDVIAVTTTPAAHLLKKATRDIPIVMVALGDPLGTGLVDSLSRPSANITGMSLMRSIPSASPTSGHVGLRRCLRIVCPLRLRHPRPPLANFGWI